MASSRRPPTSMLAVGAVLQRVETQREQVRRGPSTVAAVRAVAGRSPPSAAAPHHHVQRGQKRAPDPDALTGRCP